jgi:hypothetical protein
MDAMDTMTSTSVPLDVAAAEAHLMRFLSVEGVTGHEANIAAGRQRSAEGGRRAGVGDPLR